MSLDALRGHIAAGDALFVTLGDEDDLERWDELFAWDTAIRADLEADARLHAWYDRIGLGPAAPPVIEDPHTQQRRFVWHRLASLHYIVRANGA